MRNLSGRQGGSKGWICTWGIKGGLSVTERQWNDIESLFNVEDPPDWQGLTGNIVDDKDVMWAMWGAHYLGFVRSTLIPLIMTIHYRNKEGDIKTLLSFVSSDPLIRASFRFIELTLSLLDV